MTRMRLLTLMLVMISAGDIVFPSIVLSANAQELSKETSNQKVNMMKIRIDADGREITATLNDNATSRDFIALLPMTLTLKDYASTEKIGDLPGRLSTQGAPGGYEPSTGDITYYAPWGNLAIFHKNFQYSTGLIKLGSLDSGIEILRRGGDIKVTIHQAEK